jgi:putative oxidoreductase
MNRTASAGHDPLFVMARVLIASVFVGLGLERIVTMLGGGGPIPIGAFAFSAFEAAAGALIMIGWRVSIVAPVMALFLLVDALLSHPFWSVPSADFHGQWLHFLKNMSAIGGLLLLAIVSRTGVSRGNA